MRTLESENARLKADIHKATIQIGDTVIQYALVKTDLDSLKAELETLKSTTPRGLYQSRADWKAKAEKLAEALREIKNVIGPLPPAGCCEGSQAEMEVAYSLAEAALAAYEQGKGE